MELIHISDTHLGPTRDHEVRGANVYENTKHLIRAINDLSFTPDAVIHTGDVVYDPDEAAYDLAAELFDALKAPLYFVTGNHDETAMMRQRLRFSEKTDLLTDTDRLCYRMSGPGFDEFECLVADAKVPAEEGPHGFLSEEQQEALLAAISGTKPVALFIHYPLTAIGSPWIDDKLLVTNGELFQQRLAEKAGGMLRGIFSGHLHRGLQLYRDGILQSGVSSPACEFTACPNGSGCDFVACTNLPFDHLTITEDATMVKAYHVPLPQVSQS